MLPERLHDPLDDVAFQVRDPSRYRFGNHDRAIAADTVPPRRFDPRNRHQTGRSRLVIAFGQSEHTFRLAHRDDRPFTEFSGDRPCKHPVGRMQRHIGEGAPGRPPPHTWHCPQETDCLSPKQCGDHVSDFAFKSEPAEVVQHDGGRVGERIRRFEPFENALLEALLFREHVSIPAPPGTRADRP